MSLSNINFKFWNRIKLDTDGCWLWQAHKDGCGYGWCSTGGKQLKTHRYVYFLLNTNVSKKFLVLHKCDKPGCCNPSHLFHGTHTDNMRDMISKGRKFETLKTHCKHGHEFTEYNTYIAPNKTRKCRTCIHRRHNEFRQRKLTQNQV